MITAETESRKIQTAYDFMNLAQEVYDALEKEEGLHSRGNLYRMEDIQLLRLFSAREMMAFRKEKEPSTSWEEIMYRKQIVDILDEIREAKVEWYILEDSIER